VAHRYRLASSARSQFCTTVIEPVPVHAGTITRKP
jgi:hypothetical protein